MADYSVEHDRPNCIGCGACAAVCPAFWEMASDGKSDLKGVKYDGNGLGVLSVEEKDFACNKLAADSCPVNVIHLTNKKTGEKIT
ncbi:MAG: ferredoxin [Candidatus Micrarchaeia archaeon]|jgi:ferredoxin